MGVEGFLTAIIDLFPKTLRPRRALFAAVACMVWFIIEIPMITQVGRGLLSFSQTLSLPVYNQATFIVPAKNFLR